LAAGCFKDHPPACASGCAHCCHTRVGLNAVEARTLARALRRLPAAHLQRFRERALENAQRAKGTSANTYPRMRCALLESDDRCGAYEHRPFTCRRGHSFDADMCRRAKEGEAVGMPVDARVIAVYSEVATAFREASAGFGGDPESYELQQSLAILLAEGTDVDSADLTPALELSDGIDDATLAAASATVSAALRGGSQGPNGAPPGG